MGEKRRRWEWHLRSGFKPEWIARTFNVPLDKLLKELIWIKLTCK